MVRTILLLVGSWTTITSQFVLGVEETPVRIVLAGDSTVTDDAGWGSGFARCFEGPVEVVNLARGGRSSKNYRDEGLWQQVLESKPDYVLLQFGHNDQPGKGPHRETQPDTTYRRNMARFVDEAESAGAVPVLVTSLSRRRWGFDGDIDSTLTPYVDVVCQIAAEKGVALIDLHRRSIDVYQSLGHAGCEALSPRKHGLLDATHLNPAGAKLFGPIIAEDLCRLVPEIAQYFRPLESEPAVSAALRAVDVDNRIESTEEQLTED